MPFSYKYLIASIISDAVIEGKQGEDAVIRMREEAQKANQPAEAVEAPIEEAVAVDAE